MKARNCASGSARAAFALAVALETVSLAAGTVDLRGVSLKVTELDTDASYVNSGAAAELVFDLAADTVWKGSVAGPVTLVKSGTGILTVDGEGYQGEGGVLITNGVLKLGTNCGQTALGKLDTAVTVRGNGSLDVNYPYKNADTPERDVITHDIVLHIAGNGFNGIGAITNSVSNTHYKNRAFGRIVLDGDAFVAPGGRLDIEKYNAKPLAFTGTGSLSGPGKTLTVSPPVYGDSSIFGIMTGVSVDVQKLVLRKNATVGIEWNQETWNIPDGIEMHGPARIVWQDNVPKSGSVIKNIHAVDGENAITIGRNTVGTVFPVPIVIDEGAKATLGNGSKCIWTLSGDILNNGVAVINSASNAYSGTITNNGQLDLSRATFDGATLVNHGTLISSSKDRFKFTDLTAALDAPVTVTGTLFNVRGSLTLASGGFDWTTRNRGIDFHPSEVSQNGGKIVLRTPDANMWVGEGERPLVADGDIDLVGGNDVYLRAGRLDFPVARKMTVRPGNGYGTVFEATSVWCDDFELFGPRQAHLDGSVYAFDWNGGLDWDDPECDEDLCFIASGRAAKNVTTLLTGAKWTVATPNGVGVGKSGYPGRLALGTGTELGAEFIRMNMSASGSKDSQFTLLPGATYRPQAFDEARGKAGFLFEKPEFAGAMDVNFNGGTVDAHSDWGFWYNDRYNTDNPYPFHGANVTIGRCNAGGLVQAEAFGTVEFKLNGHKVNYTAAIRGEGGLAISGDGEFDSNRRLQGAMHGKVTVSGGWLRDLSGASVFGGGLTVGEGSSVRIGISGTNAVRAAVVMLPSAKSAGRRDAVNTNNLAAAAAYVGPFPADAQTNMDTTDDSVSADGIRVGEVNWLMGGGMGIVWVGQFHVEKPGTWTFAAGFTNGAELDIDGKKVLMPVGFDECGYATVELTAGWHDFRAAVENADTYGVLDVTDRIPSAFAWTNGVDGAVLRGESLVYVNATQNTDRPKTREIYRPFVPTELAMRPFDPATRPPAGATTVNWKYRKIGTSCPSDWMTTSTWDFSVVTNSMQGLNAYGWTTLKNSLNEYSGYFLIEEEDAGEWRFTHCYDDKVYLNIDDGAYAVTAVYAPPITNKVTLTAGWHKFYTRFWDTGGGYGPGVRNSKITWGAFKPGSNAHVKFDDSLVKIRASAEDVADEGAEYLMPGLYGEVALGAGSALTNEVRRGACPVFGSVSVGANATLSGPFRFMPGSSLSLEAGVRASRTRGLGSSVFDSTASDAFAAGGTITVNFAENPRARRIRVCASGGLEGLSAAELAARVSAKIDGETADALHPVVDDGVLYLENDLAAGLMLFVR